jgi:hypothetical protein
VPKKVATVQAQRDFFCVGCTLSIVARAKERRGYGCY